MDCIFCKIVSEEVPAYKVYEDDNFLAFLDINPRSPGHVLVVQKKHYRWVWDVPDIGAYFSVVRRVAKAQQKAFATEQVISQVVGEEVPHAHVWVFPGEDSLGDKKDLEINAQKIRSEISHFSDN